MRSKDNRNGYKKTRKKYYTKPKRDDKLYAMGKLRLLETKKLLIIELLLKEREKIYMKARKY